MNVLVTVERRYIIYNNEYYVKGIENKLFFLRYLDVFDEVTVLCRAQVSKTHPDEGFTKIDDPRIKFCPILTKGTGVFSLISMMKVILEWRHSPIIIRTPGIFAYAFTIICLMLRANFSCEVVADPVEEASSTSNNPLIKMGLLSILPVIFNLQMKMCKYSSFVTEFDIQNKYIGTKFRELPKFNSSYSSIVLNDNFYCDNVEAKNNYKIKLLFVGVLDKPFKGLDVFFKLIKLLPDKYEGIVVGDGSLLNHYKFMSENLNINNRIRFEGYISSLEKKQELYRESDIFILTSRREGLPRVVLEAMANSKPCICSRVSGVSELVDKEYIFDIDDVAGLYDILCGLSDDELYEMSRSNYEKSLHYSECNLKLKRIEFYSKIVSDHKFF